MSKTNPNARPRVAETGRTRSTRPAIAIALLGVGPSLALFAFACGESKAISDPSDSGTGPDACIICPPPERQEPAIRISAGGLNTCATRGDRVVRCWGSNDVSALGGGKDDYVSHPPPGSELPGRWASLPSRFTSSNSTACSITAENEVACWGDNSWGQTGTDPDASSQCATNGRCTKTPATVPGTEGSSYASVGGEFSCAASPKGVACWGINRSGKIGPTDAGTLTWSPNGVPGLDGISALGSGRDYSCARKAADGTIWCWGGARFGEIGRPEPAADAATVMWDDQDHPIPWQVAGLRDTRALAVGGIHACAILATGEVACWGANGVGELGHDPGLDGACSGNAKCNGQPTIIPGMKDVREIAVGLAYSCALQEGGAVQCWGSNSEGQLGHDPALDGDAYANQWSFRPQTVAGLSNVAHIVAGAAHTCVVTWGSEVWCWGADSYGQIGLPDGGSSFRPVKTERL
ncbi:RCC1 domain-containing protein [Pendulispora rubella]|uniref:RCC1 domain-containing protein n=1 Tax=Pendulispora rubella TaxID=2741070 RepID=UPI00374E1925